jgi:glucose/arabinose dehydrogenase
MRRLISILVAGSWLLAQSTSTQADGPDIRLTGEGLSLTTVATALDFSKALAALPDGSLLVGVSRPDGGSYFAASGAVLRWSDGDGDGVVEGEPQTLIEGLPGPVVGLAVAGDLVIVTTAPIGGGAISFWRRGATRGDSLTSTGELTFAMQNRLHQTYGLATRPSPAEPGAWDVVFNIGAANNAEPGDPVEMSGLVAGTLPEASLVMVTVRDDGRSLTLSQPVVIATGLRNAAALLFEPSTGDLLIADNGIDGWEDPTEPLSADEIERLPADRIGQTVDYGYPETYVAYRTGEVVGVGAEPPIATFQPIDGDEAEGVSAIAIAPPAFPAELAGRLIAGFHGQFDRTGIENEENPVRAVDLATGQSFDLIANESRDVGHIDALATIGETLYLADLCVDGSLGEAAPCGALYALRAAPGG